LLVAVLLVLQVDSVTVGEVGTVGFILGYVVKNVVPLLTSWGFKKWNLIRDSWYNRQSDIVKMAVYVVATVLLMFLFSIAGLGWDATTDANNLTPAFFENLIVALISTFLVKVGIRQEQAKRGVTHG
jgi:hypothetical protein